MPTAGKLVGALTLALTAAIAAFIFIQGNPVMPLGLKFIGGNAVVGFFVGWFTLGQHPGNGNLSAAAVGIRSLVLLLIAVGVTFSTVFVAGNLTNSNFNDPVELPLLWIEQSFNYIVLAMTKNVLIALGIGGAISGIITYQASRRWQ